MSKPTPNPLAGQGYGDTQQSVYECKNCEKSGTFVEFTGPSPSITNIQLGIRSLCPRCGEIGYFCRELL